MTQLQVQYEQYFPSYSHTVNLFYEPLGKWNNYKIGEMRKILVIFYKVRNNWLIADVHNLLSVKSSFI